MPSQDDMDQCFQRAIYEDALETLGEEIMLSYLNLLRDLLNQLGVNERSGEIVPGDLGFTAHKLISAAGMLGFMALSEAAIRLETACDEKADIRKELAELIAAGNAAEQTIQELCPAAA